MYKMININIYNYIYYYIIFLLSLFQYYIFNTNWLTKLYQQQLLLNIAKGLYMLILYLFVYLFYFYLI